MAKIFLDTNAFIDILTNQSEKMITDYNGHNLYISPLTIHIALYILKVKVPNNEINTILKNVECVNLSSEVTLKALEGPTSDFEDNIQLHSAAEEECNLFITSDEKILKTKFFGVARITSSLEVI